MLRIISVVSLFLQVFFRFHMLDKVEVSTMQYEPAVIQASDSPPSQDISNRTILSKVCVQIQFTCHDNLVKLTGHQPHIWDLISDGSVLNFFLQNQFWNSSGAYPVSCHVVNWGNCFSRVEEAMAWINERFSCWNMEWKMLCNEELHDLSLFW
jgi:hypothetical protein